MHLTMRGTAAAALTTVLAITGCRDTRSEARPDAASERGSTLVIATDSQQDEDIRYGYGRSLLFLTLLRQGDDGEIIGNLVRSWTHSLDGREWTFHLRSDVRWHDGVPVTARDLAFTFDLFSDPAVLELKPDAFPDVKVVDDTTLTLRASTPWTEANWTWEIALPEHLLQALDRSAYRSWDYWKAPVGNGPYRFGRSLPATLTEVYANEDHYAGRPSIDRVAVKFVGRAGLTELLAGKVDALEGVSATDALRIARDPRLRLYHWFNGTMAQAVCWRYDHPFFADPRVRRALTLGLDRVALHRVLHLPEDTPLPDALYTERQFRRGEIPEPLPFDTATAARLLAEAGWRDTDGDGILDRAGQPFRFSLLVPGSFYGTAQAAVVLKDQLRRLGIVAELQPMTSQVFSERFRSGDFEAAISFVSMDHRLRNVLGSNSYLRYTNPRMSELIERALATADTDAQGLLYREMTEIYRADLPVTPLFPLTSMSAVHRRVQGLSSPFRTSVTDFITELRLEEGPDAQAERSP